MKIMTAKNRFEKNWKLEEITFEDFVEKYIENPYTSNETYEEFMNMTKEEQNNLKDVGGYVPCSFETTRRAKNQKGERYAITLDADEMKDVTFNDVLEKLYGLDKQFAIHTTRKHRQGAERIRIIIPLENPIDVLEYPKLAKSFAEWIGIEIFDKTSFQAERLMFFPSRSKNGEYLYEADIYSELLNADEWLKEHPASPDKKAEKKKTEKLEDPREKANFIGAFCEAYGIIEAIEKFIPDVYEIIDDSTATYSQGSTAGGLKIYDNLHAFSFHSTDPAAGIACNAFDLVRIHEFGELDDEDELKKPINRRNSYKAMKELALQDGEVRKILNRTKKIKTIGAEAKKEENTIKQRGEEKKMETKKEFEKEPANESKEIKKEKTTVKAQGVEKTVYSDEDIEEAERLEVLNNSDFDNEDDLNFLREWAVDAAEGLTANEKGKTAVTIDNFYKILKNDVLLCGVFAFDEFSRKDYVTKPTPWNRSAGLRVLGNVDLAGASWYIEKVYNVRDVQCFDAALQLVMFENRFNYVKNYLDGLKWDGNKRLETYFIDFLKAEDNIYTREATSKMLLAGIKRALEDKVQFEQVLVLAGNQGAGKTTTIKKLADWAFNDNIHDFSGKNKNVAEELQGKWIIELAELKGFKKAESEALKNFLSKVDDVYREPYKKLAESHPRRCIFFGSTNNSEYLKDKTGNRRYWPLDVQNTMEEWLDIAPSLTQDYVDQVWAEAYEIYKQGEYSLFLSKEAEEIANNERSAHMIDNPRIGMIKEYLEKEITEDWYSLDLITRRNMLNGTVAMSGNLVKRVKVCAMDIITELFQQDKNNTKTYETNEVNEILAQIQGWEKSKNQRRFGNLGRQMTFLRKSEN